MRIVWRVCMIISLHFNFSDVRSKIKPLERSSCCPFMHPVMLQAQAGSRELSCASSVALCWNETDPERLLYGNERRRIRREGSRP